MTVEEAKEFYFQYYGYSFHMDREEHIKYTAFMRLNPGKETLREWDEELLSGLFRDFWSKPEFAWIKHNDIIKIVSRKNCDVNLYLNMLLDEMEKMACLDLHSITLVIENMAGRTEPMKDGGVYAFCRFSKLHERMNSIMEELIAQCRKNNKPDDRFMKAVNTYKKAYYKWKNRQD